MCRKEQPEPCFRIQSKQQIGQEIVLTLPGDDASFFVQKENRYETLDVVMHAHLLWPVWCPSYAQPSDMCNLLKLCVPKPKD